MGGTVVFAMTKQQCAVLTKINAGDRQLSEAERIAFFALVRRGLARGSLEEGSARLTRGGCIAAMLAAELGADRGAVRPAGEDLRRPARRSSPARAMLLP